MKRIALTWLPLFLVFPAIKLCAMPLSPQQRLTTVAGMLLTASLACAGLAVFEIRRDAAGRQRLSLVMALLCAGSGLYAMMLLWMAKNWSVRPGGSDTGAVLILLVAGSACMVLVIWRLLTDRGPAPTQPTVAVAAARPSGSKHW